MVDPLWWTIAKGVALGQMIALVGGLLLYAGCGWLYRKVR